MSLTIVLMSSEHWPEKDAARALVEELHRDGGWAEALLLHCHVHRDAVTAARWWRDQGSPVKGLGNLSVLIRAIGTANLVVVLTHQGDPDATAARLAAQAAGVPVLLLYRGAYPFLPGDRTAHVRRTQEPPPDLQLPLAA